MERKDRIAAIMDAMEECAKEFAQRCGGAYVELDSQYKGDEDPENLQYRRAYLTYPSFRVEFRYTAHGPLSIVNSILACTVHTDKNENGPSIPLPMLLDYCTVGEAFPLYIPGIMDEEGMREAIITVGLTRMSYVGRPYFICGLMEIGCGGMRGLGRSWVPTTVSLLGACGIRILWIFTVFQQLGTLDSLYVSYPISWGVTFLAHMICFFFAFRGVKRQMPADAETEAAVS